MKTLLRPSLFVILITLLAVIASNYTGSTNIAMGAVGDILFNDDFNRTTGLGSNWQTNAGGFTTDGNFAVSMTAVNFAALTTALGTNDYAVESALLVPAGSLYSGIIARGNATTSDLYAAQIATNGTVNLYRRNAYAWALLKSAAAGIVAGTSYTLNLKVSGSNPVSLEVSLNGASLFTYQDSSTSRILSGAPGIENYNTGVKYDRFTVFSITSTPSPLQSIDVTPANPTIPAGGTQQFTATGRYSDGSAKDLTASVTWSSSTPAVATMSNQAGSQGEAKGISGGSTTVTATDPTTHLSGSTGLTVTAGNQSPTARLSANPTSGAAPLSVHFDGSASSDPDGTIAAYAWDFGDGSHGSGAIADHTYTTVGTFTVTLTVTDNQGATGSASATITTTAQGTSILFNDDFNRTTGLGANWQVYYGSFATDGSNAVSQGTVANWAGITPALNSNDYTVESVLTIPSGSLYSGIVARGNPSTGFLQDLYSAQIAADGTVNLYRRNSYAWTELKSAAAGIVANQPYTLRLKVSGSNPVNLEVALNGVVVISYQDSSSARLLSGIPGMENYNSNVKYDRFTVYSNGAAPINQPPSAKLSANPTSGTVPLSVHFDGSASSDPDGTITAYAWDFGDGNHGSGATADHTYTTAGNYTVTLTVTDNQGATGTAQIAITATTTGSNILFNDDFNRTTGLGSNWQVYYGSFTTDGNNAISQDAVANWAGITPNLNTSDYTVESVLTIPSGSLYSGIVARGNPATGFLQDLYAAQIATDGTVNLYRRNAYAWTQLKSAAAGIVANQPYTLRLKIAGSNPVNLEVSLNGTSLYTYQDSSASQILSGIPGMENYNSNVKYDRFTVYSNNPGPVSQIKANPTFGVAPLTVHFDGTGSSDPNGTLTTYAWSFGDGTSGTGATIDHLYSTPGNYLATLFVTDNQGATASSQIRILVQSSSALIPRFAYVANSDSNDITMYTVDAATGALTRIGSIAAAGEPYSVTTDPFGRFAYAGNFDANTVSMYQINPNTGQLTSIGTVVTGIGPYSIVVDPTGHYAYVANENSATRVWMYQINQSSGALTAIGTADGGISPVSITTDPTGKFAYVANTSSNNVSMYRIDAATGVLTHIGEAAAGDGANGIAVHPSGKYAYVADYVSNDVWSFQIDPTSGALTQIGVAPAGVQAFSIAVDPSGQFAYVANSGTNDVSMYQVDSKTGALISLGSVAGGGGPRSVSIDPSGNFVYVANLDSDDVSAYTIDTKTGLLTPIGKFAAGTASHSVKVTGVSQPPS